MKKLIILNMVLTNNVFAAGGSGGITDLLYPTINFVTFISIIVLASRKNIVNLFKEKYNQILTDSERATNKERESKAMLDMFQKKNENLEKEISKLKSQNQFKIEKYNKYYMNEIREKTEKLKEDSVKFIENEKNVLIKEIHEEFIDEIIQKSKDDIKQQKDSINNASNKMIKDLA